MLIGDYSLNFKGFVPTYEHRSRIEVLLTEVQLRSPSQSFLAVTFTLCNGTFEGVISVTSAVEKFVVKATDATLNGLNQKLFFNLQDQLKDWNRVRFAA